MYSLPLFHGAEYILISSTETDAKTVRVGRSANGDSCWREDSYRPKKTTVLLVAGQRVQSLYRYILGS
jgi:hypothetical protein